MIRAELARLTATTMSRVALVALLLVPVLYGGLYLWANQDPYAGLDRVPVALVVDDEGAVVDGAKHNYGEDIADELVAGGDFQWHRVSAATAQAGVADARYDFSVTLPADFSAAIVSPTADTPRQAVVTLTTNDTTSYLASTIGGQAAKSLRTAIVAQVNEQAADGLLIGLSDIRSSLVTAVDGATQVTDGATSAHDGGVQLADGAAALSTGTTAVADGASRLSDGSDALAAAAGQLASGAAQVAAGNAQLSAAADSVGETAQQATDALPQARTDIQAQLLAAGVDPARIDSVLAALDPLATDLVTDLDRAQVVVARIDALSAGSAEVSAGASTLATGAASMQTGAGDLADGAAKAADGAAGLSTGAVALRDGLGELQAGAGTMRDGLQTGVDGIPPTDAATRTLQASTIADPVDLQTAAVTSAGTYGAGLAPFFASLAGWIGIYALFLIVKPVSRRAITALHSPLKITLAGWLTPGLLGAVQMAALFFVLTAVLGFSVHNPLGTYGLMALASLTFAAVILALNVWLGSVGQFLGLVLMVVQLVTAGGTFPWQTLPAPLAWLHHGVPMSYAVDGIRQLMYGGNPATAAADAGVLALWLGGALVLAAIGVTRMTHFRTLRDLRPSLIG